MTCANRPTSKSGCADRRPPTEALAELRPQELARRYRITADKRLGQHFLFDPAILDRIAAAAGPFAEELVLEIGPGPGGLTLALLRHGARELLAVERDRRCLAALAEVERAAAGRLRLLAADARRLEIETIAAGGRLVIVANLPFNIATALLLGWLHALAPVRRMVLMFQKEVALRLLAERGDPAYGRLSILTRRLCRVERLFDLPPGAFVPPPRVRATVLRLTPRPDRPPPDRLAALERVTRAAFGQRRKMLRSSLRALGTDPVALCRAAGIDAGRRAEDLSVAEFEALAAALTPASARPGGAARRSR